MYHIFLIRVFPFILIPHPVAVNLPPLAQGYRSAQNHPYYNYNNQNSNPYYGHRYINNNPSLQENPSSRTTISFPGTALAFPQRSGGGGNSDTEVVVNGQQCLTQDGKLGECLHKHQCRAYTEYTSIYAEKLTKCGSYRSQSAFICCPGKSQTGEKADQSPNPVVATTDQPKLAVESNQELSPASPTVETQPSSVDQKNPTVDISPTTLPPPPSLETSCNSSCNSTNEPFNFDSEDGQKTCGVFDASRQTSWPWIVSIGYKRNNNNTIDFHCLGTLVTTSYIITAAECLEGSPTVVAFTPLIGEIDADELARKSVVVSPIAESFQYDKFLHARPGYKNIGLVRLTEKIRATSQISPACFPFLAGVLDIINFAGSRVSTLVSPYPENSRTVIDNFSIRDYKIFKNTLCGTVVKKSLSASLKDKLPGGLKAELMCGISRLKPIFCPIPGAPVIIYDGASNSHVIIGISIGDSTCSELTTMEGKIIISTRINSFSSWVRDHVGEFPIPQPCYV